MLVMFSPLIGVAVVPSTSWPPLIVQLPVNASAAESVRTPDPSLVKFPAPVMLPLITDALGGCELRGDAQARAIVPMAEATDADWRTEYLAPVLAVKTVDNIDEAIVHIRQFGTGHTEAIIAEDSGAAEYFLGRVDSAIVLWNASTQFADGGEFGFGGEIGIATGKLHARGPVGPEQLTTFKYQLRGNGQVRP